MFENVQDFFLDRWDDFLDFKDSVSLPQAICMGLWVVFLIVVIVSVSGRSGRASAFDENFEANQLKIMELQQRRDALTSETVASAEDVQTLLKSATSEGSAVASLQMGYQDCVTKNPDGTSVRSKELVQANAKSLERYFAEGSENAVTPWFTAEYGTTSRMTWQFMTNYSFTADSVDVLWLCRDSGKRLCAFATGEYDANTKQFSDVKVYATAYGNATYRPPEDPIATYDVDPDTGEGIMVQPTNTQVPEGYHFNEFGDLVNDAGEVYMGNENWAEEFEAGFKAAKDYREQVQAAKEAQSGGAG